MRALNVSNRAQNDIVVLAEECKINNSINHTLFVRKKTTVDNNESLQVIVEIYVELATLAPFHLSSLTVCKGFSILAPFFTLFSFLLV